MNLKEALNLREKEIITVIGAGGKTSLINKLASSINSKKILVSTTTKIYVPPKELYDNMYILDSTKYKKCEKERVVVVGAYINLDNKIIGLDFYNLDKIEDDFDVLLIEGDGSKRKKLKGWNINEPVVYPKTTKVIGVLDITSYDMCINDKNIHRLKEFEKLTNTKNKVTIENMVDIVINKNGMFKNTNCEKILLINKVETKKHLDIAKNLINSINKNEHNIKIIYGSILNDLFYCV